MRGRRKSPITRRRAREPFAVDQAAAAPPERVKPSLKEQFHVVVDQQLKSEHETYEAAATAALAIKTRHPHLQVAVYDAKERRHTTTERPGAATNPTNKDIVRRRDLSASAPARGVKLLSPM